MARFTRGQIDIRGHQKNRVIINTYKKNDIECSFVSLIVRKLGMLHAKCVQLAVSPVN